MKKIYCLFKKEGLLLAIMLLFGAGISNAQVTGTVTDENGDAMIGATVRVQDGTAVAITGVDGDFQINADADDVLIITFIGYNDQFVEVNGRSVVNSQMALDANALEDIVVVGYGVQNKEEITGAVASVDSEEFNKGNIADASTLIQGKVAGVSVSRPGGDPNSAPTVRLRGISTFGGAQGPLILVDNVAVNSLEEVDPNDIESINVLKDASSSAIYGARGSNGVILVTTRSGEFNKPTKISYNGQASTEFLANTVDIASADEYRALGNADDFGASVDYIDEISQTGFSQVHNLAVDGGSSTTTYRISGTVRDVEGTLVNSGFDQFNLRGNVQHEAIDGRLTLGGNVVVGRTQRDFSFTEAFRYAASINPTIPVFDATTADGYNEADFFDYFNPVAMVEQNLNQNDNNNYKGALNLGYDLTDDLSVSANYALNVFTGQNFQFYDKTARFRGEGRNGLINRATFNTKRQTTNLLMNYDRPSMFEGVDFDGLLGYTYEQIDNDGFNASNGNFISNDASFNQLFAGTDLQSGIAGLGSYNNTQQLRGYFGRLNFNILEHFNLNTNLRYEGSNAFGENEQYGLFYGVGASADISGLADIDAVDFLKLRASYGSTGSLPPGPFLFLDPSGQSGFYPDGQGGFAPALALQRDPNPDLKWEETKELNVGIDFETAGNKLSGSLDFFDNTSEDLILFLGGDTDRFPLTGNGFANVGSIASTGLELLLNVNVVESENFSWTPTLTTTVYLNNELENLDRPFDRIANAGAPGNNDTFMILLEEGGDFGQIWGATYEGVNADGTPIYADTNGDGAYEPVDDNTVIGSGTPDAEFGLNNTFAIGNWDAQVFFRGAVGHDLVNLYRFFYESTADHAYNRVVTDNFDPNLSVAPQRTISTRVVEDADFVKLDNMTLGYTIPMNSTYLSGLRIFANGQGLATFTGYSGIDPEVRWVDTGTSDNGGFANGDSRAPGIDRRNTYGRPTTLTIGAGFNIK